MERKTILIGIILLVLYFLLFYLSNQQKKAEKIPSAPILIVPVCKNDKQVIGLLTNNEALCYFDRKLTLLRDNTEQTVETFTSENEPTYLASAHDFVITAHESIVTIASIDDQTKLHRVHTMKLAENEDLISHYTVATDQTIDIFLSILRNVTSPKQNKTAIHHLQLTKIKNTYAVSSKKYELLQMEKIISVIEKNNKHILLTNEMFPFLQPLVRVYEIRDQIIDITPSCKNVKSSTSTINSPMIKVVECRDIPEGWYQITSTSTPFVKLPQEPELNCLIRDASQSLCISENNTLESAFLNQNFILPLTSEHYSIIVQQYSTRINKNVYNCNDFGESSQITLRVCIPIL